MIDYVRCVQALADAGVEFVIIGGFAGVLHGSAYITNDLEICYSRRRENLRRLASALAPFHPRLRGMSPELPFVWDATTLNNGTVFTLKTDVGIVDLRAEVSGVGGFDQAKARSVIVSGFERQVWILDLPALIASKRAAGRPKDLMIIPELESLLESSE